MQDERFAQDRFLIDQLIRPMINLYRVTPLAVGETPAGGPIAFVRQKRMAIKEDIRFFADEQETEELFRIKARSMFDIGGARYDVKAPDESPIGVLEHQFGKSRCGIAESARPRHARRRVTHRAISRCRAG